MTSSIRARLTFWYTMMMCAVLIVFALGVLWVQQRFSRSQLDSDLDGIAAATSRVLRTEVAASGDLAAAARETRTVVDVPGRSVAILDGTGRPLAAHWRGLHPSYLPKPSTMPAFTTISDGRHRWRVHVVKNTTGPVAWIVSAAATDEVERERKLLARALLVATPFALFLSAAVCWWVASRALRPVTDMAIQAEAITSRTPDARLRVDGTADELDQVGRAFNRVLERLCAALASQQRFMADASHELRTPISIVRTAADVTLARQGRDEAEYREALSIIADQTSRLRRIVDDLFMLARADTGGYPLRQSLVSLVDVLTDSVTSMKVLAVRHGVALRVGAISDVATIGDETLLRRLLDNLIDNAIKYTPAGGSVVISVQPNDGNVALAVEDTGCGISAADRQRIFERFVRVDATRERSTGAGLGLPIARWIAETHGGTLTVEANAAGGSSFFARLPIVERQSARWIADVDPLSRRLQPSREQAS